MIIAIPIIIEPIKMASDVFWSSSISFLTENGVILTTIKKAMAKTTKPIRTKIIVVRTTGKSSYSRRSSRPKTR